MITVRVYYDFSLWPNFDDSLKRIAKKHYLGSKNIGSGSNGCTRDIEFNFPTNKIAIAFKEEASNQGGVKHTRLPASEPLPKGFMI